jgi:hypothetical protein
MATALGFGAEAESPDDAALTAEFITFLKDASRRRHGTGPIRRFNQGRHTACVHAEFNVLDDLPGPHKVGLFSRPGSYPAIIRFANATSSSDEERDVRGMSISVAAIQGTNLTPGQNCQDFVLNSHPVMMAPDAREFLALLRANEEGGVKRAFYFATHPTAARIAIASRENPTSHLDIPYWSTTPYLFGQGRAVKYVVRPVSDRKSTLPEKLTPSYLHAAMKAHLAQADALFDFMIQFHVDDDRTPIEDATVEWKEHEHRVAQIRIPKQPVDTPAHTDACEAKSFNPWYCLEEHRPLGGMNRARREIYEAMGEFRRASART